MQVVRRRYVPKILPIRRKTLIQSINQSINKSINQAAIKPKPIYEKLKTHHNDRSIAAVTKKIHNFLFYVARKADFPFNLKLSLFKNVRT